MPELISMKLGVYIMAHEPITAAHFTYRSHHSVFLYTHPTRFTRQLLGKKLTQQRYTCNCSTPRFLCGPCRIKEK
jgi:hypothetical protein